MACKAHLEIAGWIGTISEILEGDATPGLADALNKAWRCGNVRAATSVDRPKKCTKATPQKRRKRPAILKVSSGAPKVSSFVKLAGITEGGIAMAGYEK